MQTTHGLQAEIERLNPQQRQAVEAISGRVLVLAGAGSGKTKVLTIRIAHLIVNHGVAPDSIVGLTFTNKAAGEMRQRLAALIGKELAGRVTLSTFHSFCMRILRADIERLGYTSRFTLYDPKDVERLVTHIVRDVLRHEGEMPTVAPIMAAIGRARNKGADISDVVPWQEDFHREVYERLHQSMRAHNAVDFDSLLWLTVRLFREHPDVLAKYQDQFRHLLIDEYQDTNPVQYEIASALSAKYGNLFVVGDDDQSIYGWRGAEVKHILDFDSARTVRLEQNYRSTNHILAAANAVIAKNEERYAKTLWSERGQGDTIEIFHAPSEVDEAEAVAARLKRLRERVGLRWRDMAILYRSNALSRQLEMALMKFSWQDGSRSVRGIPYQIYGGLEFYERSEVKDLIAYLRVIVNRRDHQALLRIVNTPRRGIGERVLDQLTQRNRQEGLPLWQLFEETPKIQAFVQLINTAAERFEHDTMSGAMEWLIDAVNYEKAIREEAKSQKLQDMKRENILELVSAVAEYEAEAEAPSLSDFLSSTALGSERRKEQKDEGQADCVSLMTFHSSKGLEFPACFLVGLEDRIIPHERSVKEGGLSEERRLMYVALTRAQKYLCCSMAQTRRKHGEANQTRPSPFLFDIPKELLRVTSWDAV